MTAASNSPAQCSAMNDQRTAKRLKLSAIEEGEIRDSITDSNLCTTTTSDPAITNVESSTTPTKTSRLVHRRSDPVAFEIERRRFLEGLRSEFAQLISNKLQGHVFNCVETASNRRDEKSCVNKKYNRVKSIATLANDSVDHCDNSASPKKSLLLKTDNFELHELDHSSIHVAIPPPREAFNRWLFSRDKTQLKNEIVEDVPIKIPHWYPVDAETRGKEIRCLHSTALKQWAKKFGGDGQVSVCGKKIFETLEVETVITPNELRDITKKITAPILDPIVDEIVDCLETKMADWEKANLKASSATETLSQGPQNTQRIEKKYSIEVDFDLRKKIYSLAAVDNVEDSAEDSLTSGANTNLSENDFTTVKISIWAYNKLTELFQPKLTEHSLFEEIFCCASRYEGLCGSLQDVKGGMGLQSACPQGLFDALRSYNASGSGSCKMSGFHIYEGFASPFNVSVNSAFRNTNGSKAFRQSKAKEEDEKQKLDNGGIVQRNRYNPYCSCFPEDRVFSSKGSFFSMDWVEASDVVNVDGNTNSEQYPVLIECNPPFDVAVMHAMIDRIEKSLDEVARRTTTTGTETIPSLSFLVIIPEWQPSRHVKADTISDHGTDVSTVSLTPLERLLQSKYLASTFVRRPQQHGYVKGRCWAWNNLDEIGGPPIARGVSKSRACLLTSVGHSGGNQWNAEEFMARVQKGWAVSQ